MARLHFTFYSNCSYCSRLAQASADIKKSALPCLSAAISRAGLCAGAGGEEEEAAAVVAAGVGGPDTTTATSIATVERTIKGRSAKHDAWQSVASERALCRLVQAASTSAAGGTVGRWAEFCEAFDQACRFFSSRTHAHVGKGEGGGRGKVRHTCDLVSCELANAGRCSVGWRIGTCLVTRVLTSRT